MGAIIFKNEDGTVSQRIDAFLTESESHTASSTMTLNPVSKGVKITDHIEVEPDAFTIDILVGEFPLIERDDPDLNFSIYERLKRAIRNKELCDMETIAQDYFDVRIKTLTKPQVKGHGFSFRGTLTVQELLIATTQTTTIPATAFQNPNRSTKKSQKENKGKKGADASTTQKTSSLLSIFRAGAKSIKKFGGGT